jgi:N-methylhydantoinase A/oxoprolinase/acetone carboxylase beta subunit
MLRLGVDVGGTFTDVFVFDPETGQVISAKGPTTPENQAIGVRSSLAAAGAPAAGGPISATGR